MDIKSPVAEARNEYTYSAGGQKLKVVQKWNSNYSTTPVIGSAVNTTALNMTKTTDYVGNKVYENGSLKRILIDGGFIDGGTYHFYAANHLGNNHIVADAVGTVTQMNHYYPFGTAFAETSKEDQDKQPYKYNGKELDQRLGLKLYDYLARQMDGAIGRFMSVDPLAEKYYSWSTYVYVGNNPMRRIDPTGEDWVDFLLGIGKGIEQRAKGVEKVISTLAHEGPIAVGQLMAPTSATDALVKAGDFVTLGAVSANVD
ncbi:MAG: RHS repeat-associated core domain-containing protein, partial [Dysgonomonas sp.]|nr:RHS repeat-associated core domain-containing protein [Dysgonomonas sp.]